MALKNTNGEVGRKRERKQTAKSSNNVAAGGPCTGARVPALSGVMALVRARIDRYIGTHIIIAHLQCSFNAGTDCDFHSHSRSHSPLHSVAMASAQEIQLLLRFLSQDAKVPLAQAMGKVKDLQSARLIT